MCHDAAASSECAVAYFSGHCGSRTESGSSSAERVNSLRLAAENDLAAYSKAHANGTPIAQSQSMERETKRSLNLSFEVPPPRQKAGCPTQKRLTEAFACLARLACEREQGDEPVFGRFIEQQIIWRELLELELQDTDEQIERIVATAGTEPE